MSRKSRPPRDASRRYHDRVARQYDSIYEDPYWIFHDELTWRLVKPYLPTDLSVPCADLGCGTGKWGLRLLKSGFAVTFVDNSAAMVGETRGKLDEMGNKGQRATTLVADIVDLAAIPDESFGLVLAMGDPLSICSDAARAAREIHRTLRPNGVVIATADNQLAALDHYAQRGNLDELEEFVHRGKTHWLTADDQERFELTTFTPASLRKLFEHSGLTVEKLIGKPVLPVRLNKLLLEQPGTIERLLRLETELSRDPASAARAAHLQIVGRRG